MSEITGHDFGDCVLRIWGCPIVVALLSGPVNLIHGAVFRVESHTLLLFFQTCKTSNCFMGAQASAECNVAGQAGLSLGIVLLEV